MYSGVAGGRPVVLPLPERRASWLWGSVPTLRSGGYDDCVAGPGARLSHRARRRTDGFAEFCGFRRPRLGALLLYSQ
jgi:hypothetical protein